MIEKEDRRSLIILRLDSLITKDFEYDALR